MTAQEQKYAAIAANMRSQKNIDLPLKHEWVELITRLSREEDPQLRETGICELSRCADQANRHHHV
jgi:hypothetical protein